VVTAPAGGTLLLISPTEDPARSIETALRNAGHPLRLRWVAQADAFEDQLRNNPPDLVIIDRGDGPSAAREQLFETCRRLLPERPLLLLDPPLSLDTLLAARAAGADDCVGCDSPAQLRHLEQVVLRELADQDCRRQLRQARSRLADFEARHEKLTDSTGDAVACIQEGIVVRANAALAERLGVDDPAALTGQPLIDLVAASQQADIKARLRAVLKGAASSEPLQLQLAGRHGVVTVEAQMILGQQDGEQVIELLIRAAGAPPGRAAPATLPPPAAHRGGARAAFREALGEAVAAGRTRAALLICFDDFAGLETRLGVVDAETLAGLASAAIAARLAPEDRVFGFSVDERALLVERPDLAAIETLAETLRRELREEIFNLGDCEAQLSLSIALLQPGPGEAAERVIRQLVDEARGASAKDGNRVVIVGSATRTAQAEREEARIAALTRRALAEDRLRLAWQSIASLEGETRHHYDLLVRMSDDTGREWTASEFLPAAQKFNLMRSIDRWVIGSALELISRRSRPQDAATLFVKISEDSIRDADAFLGWLRELLGGRRLTRDEIVFEAQERVLQNHIRKARQLARELVELGAGFAIEHFGIGPSSAQMLDHLPVHFLKFHASFTQSFGERATIARLSELVEAAKQHRIKTIVSHVEDANVMARLWQMGVNYISGYHVQEPEVVLLSDDPLAAKH
jgi:EAL domain-containing protein (putative c-di-GMP-specific phosphodiesterase class I)